MPTHPPRVVTASGPAAPAPAGGGRCSGRSRPRRRRTPRSAAVAISTSHPRDATRTTADRRGHRARPGRGSAMVELILDVLTFVALLVLWYLLWRGTGGGG